MHSQCIVQDTCVGTDERVYNELYRRVGDEDRDNHYRLHYLRALLEYELVNCDCQNYIQEGSHSGEYHIVQQRILRHIPEDVLGSKQEFKIFDAVPWACPDTLAVVKGFECHHQTAHRYVRKEQ